MKVEEIRRELDSLREAWALEARAIMSRAMSLHYEESETTSEEEDDAEGV